MAEGAATEEDKAKKISQIEKLNKMIADNETESAKLKESATNKENQAKEASDKSNFILINTDENNAKSFTAIEKAETFDNEFMAEAMNRTSEPTNEEPLANNEQPEVNNEEPVVEEPNTNNEEPNTNREVPVINNEEPFAEEPIINNEEPVINNEEPVVNTEEPVINNEQPTANVVPENIDEIPEVLNQSIFVINNNQAVYSDDNRIPTTTKLPEGLVFKVQIGAFRNPIPQNHFRGFAPILAEDAGNGITRYTAGLFKTFNMANEAKSSIRSIGYSDAFVVAFFNGKRINIGEARAMLDGSVVDEGNFTINNTTSDNNTENTTNDNITENNPSRTEDTEEVKDGVSTDVRNIDGVFYAVQVGVYSKQVTAGQLNNVSPLNSERTSSGLIRYTSGVFKTLDEANAAKDRIRGLGISDAFVVAYNGGTKITVSEATNLLSSGESNRSQDEEPVIENTPIEDTPVEDAPVEDAPIEDTIVEDIPVEEAIVEDTPVEKTFKNEIPGYEPKEDLNLEFKVKLGEYEEDVPVEDAGLFLRLTGRGVKNYEKGDKTIYTIGSFPDYESALDLQIEMKEMGVKNPQTIVFRDGVEMSLEDAFELMKNNQ
ncbi:MAG: SPOR domain-containing protein [Flavobacteriales bacterium]|nr:SPOR domain-containing protein [Flavobacteriales bacterium]